MTDMALLHEYVELIHRKRELESQLRQVKEQLGETEGSGPGAMERRALEYFGQNGVQSLKLNGMTLYVNRQLWAHAKDGDFVAGCLALKEAGLGDFVAERFNVQSLSAWVRERDRNGEPLPEAFKDRIEVSEVFRLGARRS